MFLLKLLMKVIVFPVMLTMTLIQWAGEFLIGMSSAILNIIAGLILLIAGLSYLMGICAGQEALIIALTGFLFFLIPRIGGAVVSIISVANNGLRRLMKS